MEQHERSVRTPATPVCQGTDAHAAAVASWNLLIHHRPAAAFAARRAEDVAEAVRYARRHGRGVAPLATGHGSPAIDASGVVVNTSAMNRVTVDPGARTATVGAGAHWRDLHNLSGRHGLVGVCGSSSNVGVVGFVQGGGFGWLSRRLGFASSSVRAAQLVTADGEIMTVDEDHHPEVLWGVAGGAGNLGIVTRLTLDLHRVGADGDAGPATVVGGNLYHSLDRAAEVASFYSTWAPTLPPIVMSALTFRWFPPAPTVPEHLRGRTVVAVRLCASGPSLAEAHDLMQVPRAQLGPALLDTITTLPAHDLDPISADPTMPVPACQRGETVAALTPEVIEVLVEETVPVDGPPLAMLELRHLGAAMNDAPRGPHPMARTTGQYSINAVSLVPSPELEPMARDRHTRIFDRLRPHLTGTTYLNFLEGPGATRDRVRAAYDDADWERLVDLKTALDPDNVFHHGRNIAPRPPQDSVPNTQHHQDQHHPTHMNGVPS